PRPRAVRTRRPAGAHGRGPAPRGGGAAGAGRERGADVAVRPDGQCGRGPRGARAPGRGAGRAEARAGRDARADPPRGGGGGRQRPTGGRARLRPVARLGRRARDPGPPRPRASGPVSGAPELAPLLLSLRVSLQATVLALLAGLPVAWLLARRDLPGRDFWTVLVLLPMVLPPTVLGYYLLLAIGRGGPVARLAGALGVERIVFTPAA